MNGNKDKNSFGKLEVTLPSDGEYGGGTVGAAELDKRREKLFEESKVLGKMKALQAQLLMQKKELAALHAKARRPKGKDALGGAQGKGQ